MWTFQLDFGKDKECTYQKICRSTDHREKYEDYMKILVEIVVKTVEMIRSFFLLQGRELESQG